MKFYLPLSAFSIDRGKKKMNERIKSVLSQKTKRQKMYIYNNQKVGYILNFDSFCGIF